MLSTLPCEKFDSSNKQPNYPICKFLHQNAAKSGQEEADSLMKSKWKMKMSKSSHKPEREKRKKRKSALLGERNVHVHMLVLEETLGSGSWSEERRCIPSARMTVPDWGWGGS